MAIDYSDLNKVLDLLSNAQDVERDMREACREAHYFVDKRDGQWEAEIANKMNGRPRYTFDKCNPIIDQIAGEIEQAEFTLRVSPAGGEATDDVAETMDGIIRNIRNMSSAESIFESSARNMITGGIDGWEIVQDYVDSDSFNQDLLIKRIPNYCDRVWFDTGAVEPDLSDASYVFVLQDMTPDEYDEKFPDAGSKSSIGSGQINDVYYHKPDFITVGRILYKKPFKKELVLMSDGSVYEVDEKFEKVSDELADNQITEVSRRSSNSFKIHQRIFNGDSWLTDEEPTVFTDYLPVIPIIGNFKVSDSKVTYRGIIEKLIDAQRVYNYARSREIEEGALAPRAKWWITREQAAKDTKTISTMNTNSDPAQLYTHVDGQPAPYFAGGAQINQGLQLTAASASDDINKSAGLFDANMGNNPGLQSGVAIEQQIGKGDNGTIKWFKSLETAICATGRVIIKAMPKVYDATRTVRVLGEDGTGEMVSLNERIIDEQSQQIVEINDLTKGQYDVVCEVGDAFKSRQKETAQAFSDIAAIDPSVIEIAKDVWFNNLNVPGMKDVSKRVREQLVNAGAIPQDQLTDEEIARIQEAQANQQQQPDPNMVIAQAELMKGQAEQLNAQNKQAEIQGSQQLKSQELQLQMLEIQLKQQEFERAGDAKFNVEAAKIDQGQQKIDLDQQKAILAQQQQQIDNALKLQQQQQQELNDAFDNLKTMREAIGADAIITPVTQKAYVNQTKEVIESQED